MRMLVKLIRIYTPFICTLVALINGVYFMRGGEENTFVFLSSALTGNSIIVDIYMIAMSFRMCFWYKLNIAFLMAVQVIGALYDCLELEFSVYLLIVVLLSTAGVMCFLIFRILHLTCGSGCNHRHSVVSE